MKLSSNKRGGSKPLEVIYEDPYAQNTNEIDPKQREILEKILSSVKEKSSTFSKSYEDPNDYSW